VLDGKGPYLTPGLIDSHVHLANAPGMTPEQAQLHPDIEQAARRQEPRSFLSFGFTTLIDLIATPETMARWKSRSVVAPELASALIARDRCGDRRERRGGGGGAGIRLGGRRRSIYSKSRSRK